MTCREWVTGAISPGGPCDPVVVGLTCWLESEGGIWRLHFTHLLFCLADSEGSALVRHATPGGSQALGFSRTARRAGLCDLWPGEAAVAMLAVAGGAAGETWGPRGTSLHIDGRYLPLQPRGLWRALGGHVLGASAWPSGQR